MATTAELKNAMTKNLHQVPGALHSSGINLHYNKSTGELWCYCENCDALAALDPNGRMYGAATNVLCTELTKSARERPRK